MKKFIIGFLVFLFALIAGAVIFVLTFDINTYKSQIESALQDATGYSFSLKGKIVASMSFEPTVSVDNVEIKNKESFEAPFLFSAKKAQISFDLKSLLKDVIVVHSVRLSDVNLNLEVAMDGTPNWSPSKTKPEKTGVTKPSLTKAPVVKNSSKTATIVSVVMKNVNVSYQNAKTGQSLKLLFPTLSVQQLVNFVGDVVYKKENFSFSGSIKNLLTVLATQRNLNFSFDVKSSLAKGKITGVCRDLKDCGNDMTLNLNISGNDLQKAYAFFFQKNNNLVSLPFMEQAKIQILRSVLLLDGSFSFPDTDMNLSYNIEQNLSDGSGRGVLDLSLADIKVAHKYGIEPFSLKTNYTLSTDKVLEFSNLTAMFDETDIDGSIRVAFADKKPKIDASLHSHYFKLSNLIYMPENSDAQQKTENKTKNNKLFSDKTMDFSFLKLFDASLNLNVDYLGFSNVFLRHPQLYLAADLKDSVLTVTVNEGSSFAGGKVVGKSVLNTQNVMPTLDIDLIAQDLKLNQVNMWKDSFKSGDVGVNLFLKTKGKSASALLANLDGSILIMANQVDILSPIVGRLFPENTSAVGSKAAQELFIKCAVLNATAQNGVIHLSQKAGLETGKFNMIVDGDIDLKEESLDLHFVPQRNNKSQKAAPLSDALQGVALKGSLSEPVPSIEVNVAKLFPEETSSKVSEKQAFLNSYTKNNAEYNSVCRMALGTDSFKDIDTYFGRDLVVEEVKKPAPVEVSHEITRAQKVGREFLDSLSGVLSTENKKTEPSAKDTDSSSVSTAK